MASEISPEVARRRFHEPLGEKYASTVQAFLRDENVLYSEVISVLKALVGASGVSAGPAFFAIDAEAWLLDICRQEGIQLSEGYERRCSALHRLSIPLRNQALEADTLQLSDISPVADSLHNFIDAIGLLGLDEYGQDAQDEDFNSDLDDDDDPDDDGGPGGDGGSGGDIPPQGPGSGGASNSDSGVAAIGYGVVAITADSGYSIDDSEAPPGLSASLTSGSLHLSGSQASKSVGEIEKPSRLDQSVESASASHDIANTRKTAGEPTASTEPSEPSVPVSVDSSTPVEPSEPSASVPVDAGSLVEAGNSIDQLIDLANAANSIATTIETSADPSEPTDPVDPSEPTDPVDPSEPTDPVDPSEPTDPVDPSEPTDPVDPSEPTDPVDPSEPTDPVDPSEPKACLNPCIFGKQFLDVSDLSSIQQLYSEYSVALFSVVVRDSDLVESIGELPVQFDHLTVDGRVSLVREDHDFDHLTGTKLGNLSLTDFDELIAPKVFLLTINDGKYTQTCMNQDLHFSTDAEFDSDNLIFEGFLIFPNLGACSGDSASTYAHDFGDVYDVIGLPFLNVKVTQSSPLELE